MTWIEANLNYLFLFFFQAEDGIRDKLVTGVQTCALPILETPDRLRSSALGLASALLFGLGAPVSKLLLPGTQTLVLAALLYLGAGLAFLLARPSRAEAPLARSDAPWLAASVIAGAGAAPVFLLFGLARLSGLAGSLLLNLEAPFTIALAVLVFGEHLSGREAAAAAIVVLG